MEKRNVATTGRSAKDVGGCVDDAVFSAAAMMSGGGHGKHGKHEKRAGAMGQTVVAMAEDELADRDCGTRGD